MSARRPAHDEAGAVSRRAAATAVVVLLVVVAAAVVFARHQGTASDTAAGSPGPATSSSSTSTSASPGTAGGGPSTTPTPSPATSGPASSSTSGGAGNAEAERPRQTAVPLNATATAAPRVQVRVTKIESVQSKVEIPGEVSRPALRLTVVIANGRSTALKLGSPVANLFYGKQRTPAAFALKPGSRPFPGTVAARGQASGVFVFNVPKSARSLLRLEVDLTDSMRIVAFTGAA